MKLLYVGLCDCHGTSGVGARFYNRLWTSKGPHIYLLYVFTGFQCDCHCLINTCDWHYMDLGMSCNPLSMQVMMSVMMMMVTAIKLSGNV